MWTNDWTETPSARLTTIPAPMSLYAINWGVQFPQAIPKIMPL